MDPFYNLVGSVRFTTDPQEMEVGSTVQLTFEVYNLEGVLLDFDDAEVRRYGFSSSDESVATVTETGGLVTAVAPGTAHIRIQTGSCAPGLDSCRADVVLITVVAAVSSIIVTDADID